MRNIKRRYLSTLSVIALIASSTWASAYAVTFTPPAKNGAPNQATGGASRGSFFTPTKGNSAPSQATGGASRGSFFTPTKGNSAPSQATGGASRGNLFTPANDNSAPQQASGGASRGNLFTPANGNSAPQQASGGASRGNLFTPANGNSAPQQASGGASRVGTYLNPTKVAVSGPAALIAVLPQSFYGTTLSELPTVMVYIPASNAKEAVFSIKDEAGNMYHKMTIPVAGQSGVIAVKLPADAPALAVGKNYHWFLAVKVDGQLSPSTPYVDGWIERIQPTAELATAMQQKDALSRATALGKNGVWYDCVATLAALYVSQPNNPTIIKQWEELLSSVSLKEIVTAPLTLTKR